MFILCYENLSHTKNYLHVDISKKITELYRLFCDKIPRYHVRDITPASEKFKSESYFLHIYTLFNNLSENDSIIGILKNPKSIFTHAMTDIQTERYVKSNPQIAFKKVCPSNGILLLL